MDAKQFLALNESMIAIQVLMSGDLKKETADAKAALDLLGGAKAAASVQAQLDQDKADFENYKSISEDTIAADKTALASAQDQLAQDKQAHQSDLDSLASDRSSLAAEKAQFEADKLAHQQDISTAQNALADAQSKVTQQSNDLSAAQRAVDVREQAVADKLAAMKAIV